MNAAIIMTEEKANVVAIRYTADGSHKGEPHNHIQPTGQGAPEGRGAVPGESRQAHRVHQGVEQACHVGQLGWPTEECLSQGE